MSKSLAELRQSPRVGLPRRAYQLCVSSAILGEYQSLLAQLEDATATEAAQSEGDESRARPKRMGEKSSAADIRARLSELRGDLAEHTGTLVLQGITEGEWRLWVDAHPAREDSDRDNTLAFGCCNADDLIDNLGTFAHSWNGDDLKPGDWDFLKANAAPGDIKTLAQLVVTMHESVVDIPKLLSSSLGILSDATG